MLERLETSRGPGGWLGDDTPVVVTEFCATNEPLAAQIEVMDEVHAMLLERQNKRRVLVHGLVYEHRQRQRMAELPAVRG